MSTTDLKNTLIRKISTINDIPFLMAIQTIIDSKVNQEIFSLSAGQQAEIIQSKKDIEAGLFIDNEQLNDEVTTWLNEK